MIIKNDDGSWTLTSEDALELANTIKELEYKYTNAASQLSIYEKLVEDYKSQIQQLQMQIEILKIQKDMSILDKLLFIAAGGALGFLIGGLQ